MNKKSAFNVQIPIVRKNGFKAGKQQNKCYSCGKHFLGRLRIINEALWKEYVEGKQIYQQLSEKHKCSVKTIQIRIGSVIVGQTEKRVRSVIVLMNTTY